MSNIRLKTSALDESRCWNTCSTCRSTAVSRATDCQSARSTVTASTKRRLAYLSAHLIPRAAQNALRCLRLSARAALDGLKPRRCIHDFDQSAALTRDIFGQLCSRHVGQPAQHGITIDTGETAICVEIGSGNFSGMQSQQQVGTTNIGGRIAPARVDSIDDERVRDVTQDIQWMEIPMTQPVAVWHGHN